MKKHAYTRRSAVIVGAALIVIWAAVVSTWDSGGSEFVLFAATVAYSLGIVGLTLGTLSLFRNSQRRTRMAMAVGLAAFAVLGMVQAANYGQAEAVIVCVEVILGMIVVDAIVLFVRLVQYRQGKPKPE